MNTTQPNNAQLNNPKQILSQEQKLNLENVKRIWNNENINLSSWRNIALWKVKTETNKINQVLPYISTNNITELNELIYAWAKLVCEKVRIPSNSTKKNSKPRLKMRLETQKTPLGFRDTNGLPNLGQTTRSYNNEQEKRICKIIDFAVPAYHRVKLKEFEKEISISTLQGNWRNCVTWKWR